ncbi:MAG: nucleotidyltransferase family protein [Prevotella sp.]|nr:nucleotidyltransferase family protein [Prevotella sp.]
MNRQFADYLDFMRFSLGEGGEVPASVKAINWHSLYEFAGKQSVVGVYWTGLQRLGELKENKPTDDDVLEWMGTCQQIAKRNQTVSEKSAWVAGNFEHEGFKACLLKGQGNAMLYPDPTLRTPGDIDIWVKPMPQEGESGSNAATQRSSGSSAATQRSSATASRSSGSKLFERSKSYLPRSFVRHASVTALLRSMTCGSSAASQRSSGSSSHFSLFTSREDVDIRTVIAYCRRFVPKAKACYHHIDFLKAGDVPVEVHYRPSWLNNPFHNRRLQRYFLAEAETQFGNHQPSGFSVPTWEFNLVFQLSHIANHLLHEGIGLRQIIDYYYLLKSNTARRAVNDYEREFKRLGLLPFARQLMWVLHEVLGLEESLLVARQDERRGRLLLSEMLAGGNFGKYDERMLSGAYSGVVKKNVQRIVRDVRLMWYFPSECFWEPFFRLWHFFWRKNHSN